MGTRIGHVANGSLFIVIGLWHLFNHTKLYALEGMNYRSLPWFPAASHRHMELYLMMVASAASTVMELTLGLHSFTPFEADGTIYFPNLEHSSIAIIIFVYAVSAIVLDNQKMIQLVAAMVFAQELLLIHLHSADHMGVEGQYHWLLQLVIAFSLATTILVIAWPESFIVSYARSLSLVFQGVWLIHIGIMLYTPSLTPKGCFLSIQKYHEGIRCHGSESLHRAKALVNIGFSWFLIGLAVFAVSFYLLVMRVYADDQKYLQVDDAETQPMVEFTGETPRS